MGLSPEVKRGHSMEDQQTIQSSTLFVLIIVTKTQQQSLEFSS